jgi:hypothetical protein
MIYAVHRSAGWRAHSPQTAAKLAQTARKVRTKGDENGNQTRVVN